MTRAHANPLAFTLLYMFLLSICLCIGIIAHSQDFGFNRWSVVEMSVDPRSADFIMFQNNKLSVETITIKGNTMLQMFGADARKIQFTTDSIYFVLNKDSYKVWVPEIQTLILVKPLKNKPMVLGWHLIKMIETMRDFKKTKQYSSN